MKLEGWKARVVLTAAIIELTSVVLTILLYVGIAFFIK